VKIAVIGPGAIGCLFAAYLGRTNEVWLLDHRPERAARLARQGLVLERDGRREKCRIGATVDPHLIGPVDLALLCVKSSKVRDGLRNVAPLCNRASLLLTLQNGIDHLPVLPELLGRTTSWGLGITAQGATLRGPGHVCHQGRGLTRIGLPPNSSPHTGPAHQQLARAAAVLTGAGLETEPVPDILNHIWAKLLVNIGINALTAIHDCANGALLESPATLAIMTAAVREGQQVAEKIGIVLADDPLQTTLAVCRATAANRSSMLQDVRAGRPTEIDAINGALLRKAAELGIAAPVNTELVRQVKAIEQVFCEFP
jgi:2-dehydropantoate 2-reductase